MLCIYVYSLPTNKIFQNQNSIKTLTHSETSQFSNFLGWREVCYHFGQEEASTSGDRWFTRFFMFTLIRHRLRFSPVSLTHHWSLGDYYLQVYFILNAYWAWFSCFVERIYLVRSSFKWCKNIKLKREVQKCKCKSQRQKSNPNLISCFLFLERRKHFSNEVHNIKWAFYS